MVNLVGIALLTIFIYMTLWYFVALIVKKNDIADIAWGLGFIVVCSMLYIAGSKTPQFIIIFVLTALWGTRLVLHIYFRNGGKDEDYRYKKRRQEWGKWFLIGTYVEVFLLQGCLTFLISFTAIYAAISPVTSIKVTSYVGVLMWLIGFIFESSGDMQLSRFIANKDNAGKIMTGGLWRYTRHPNYFGEVTQWWGLFVFVALNSFNFISIVSPITITFLILKVSGIPMLEKRYEGNAEYESYKKVTNAFFPWFPKKH